MKNSSYIKGKRLYFITCVLLGIGLILLLIYHAYDLHFSGHLNTCFMNIFLHIYCPGCGGTRAIDYFLHGQFLKSLACHPIIIYVAGLFLSYFIPATYTYLYKKDGKKYYHFHPWTLYIIIAIILGFFVLRNVLLIYCHYDFLGDCIDYWLTRS